MPTLSTKSSKASSEWPLVGLGTTIVYLPFVKTMAQVFPSLDLTWDIIPSMYHLPWTRGRFSWRWSTLSLLVIGWTAVLIPRWVVDAKVSFAVCRVRFHFLASSSGVTALCLVLEAMALTYRDQASASASLRWADALGEEINGGTTLGPSLGWASTSALWVVAILTDEIRESRRQLSW